ncbi:GH25 family lysozyme [Latilactobacillus sp. 5-91]|uniref:GH25 family lysozyme n=1 Tax=Latilactobacillus sp. 5-91 TaxID=3410924 RepID=UPI003C78CC50
MKKIVTLTLGTLLLSSALLTPNIVGAASQTGHSGAIMQTIINEHNNHAMGDLIKRSELTPFADESGISAAETGRPAKDFIDISSNNGSISKDEFQLMKNKYGIKGVIVKLTEGDSYRNPLAPEQIANAKAAGLKVSVYHFSWFANTQEAAEEATYFMNYAKELNLAQNTSFVNDYEAVNSSSATTNTLKFADTLKAAGFKNVYHYSSKSWFSSVLDMTKLGPKTCWVAEWPMNPSENQLLHTENASWQWASDLYFPELGNARHFDISTDYLNAFS